MRARSAVLAGVLFIAPSAKPTAPTVAVPNDNRTPAGTLSDSGLTVILEARRVMWDPDGYSLRGRATEAFEELARQVVSMGETYDFEYTAATPGILRVEVRAAGANGILLARVPIRVQ